MHEDGAGDFGVGSWIERRARVRPDQPALIHGARTSTYAELAERIRRLANGLRGLGVERGDRVAWLGPNHPAFLETFFATGQLGAVLAPVNHRLAREVQAEVLALTEPVALVEHGGVTSPPAGSIRHRLAVGAGPRDAIDLERLIAGSPDDPIGGSVGADDLAFLPHTSGTTGRPKAVMLTHGNITWNAVNFLSVADFRAHDVTAAIAPFFRVGGTGVNVLPVLFVGGTVVVPDDPSPDGLLGLLQRHRVTVGFANPDLLDAIARADTWRSADLSNIRFILTGGAPVPERLIRTYLDHGLTLVQGYGQSEAGPLVLLLDAARALDKIGSAGRPPLFVDIRIADPGGADVAPGQTGELLVRGPNVMAGYWRHPAETSETIRDGVWLRTGDAARVDGDGDVWIVDRFDARFTSADGVVYPGDVERALLTHPAVADAGVVGIPGQDGSMVGVAIVVPATGADVTAGMLLAYCRDRLVAHEVPAAIVFAPELPRNAVGKLLRRELAQLAVGDGRDGPTIRQA
ncbi:MAG TPA: AMP-binding protein [Candidatus Limnocylindrales bacterium]